MPLAEVSPSPKPGVAGVRLSNRRQLFVEGVPPDLPSGAVIRLLLEDQEVIGTVSIPPDLVVWRDPDARCATFVSVQQLPEPPLAIAAAPPAALFLAEHSAPDDVTLSAMLNLARAESDRLDD